MSAVCFQGEPAECGLASLVMIAEKYGVKLELSELRKHLRPSDFGVSLAELRDLAKKCGVDLMAIKFDVQDLAFIKTPVILHLHAQHFIVLEKVNDYAAVILDPAMGRDTVHHDYLKALATGYALVFSTDECPPQSPTSWWRHALDAVKRVFSLPKDPLLLLLSVIAAAISFVLPLFAFSSPEKLLARESLTWWYLVGFLLTIVFSQLFEYLSGKRSQYIHSRYFTKEIVATLKKMLQNKLGFFERRLSTDVMNRVVELAGTRARLSTIFSSVFVGAGVTLCSFAIMATINIMMASTVTVVCIITAILANLHRIKAILFQRQELEYQDHVDRMILDGYTLASDIKSAGTVNEYALRLRHLVDELKEFNQTQFKHDFYHSSMRTFVERIGQVLIIYMLFSGVAQNEIMLGQAFAFMMIMQVFMTAFQGLIGLYVESSNFSATESRARDLLEFETDHTDYLKPEHQAKCTFMNDIHAMALSYILPEKNIARPVYFPSFHLNKGAVQLIKGKSGSGKTTLLKIMSGHYNAYFGEVLIDGQCVSSDMLQQLSYYHAQQQCFLSASLWENITLFSHDISKNNVYYWLEHFSLIELVESLPNGLETQLSESVHPFSSGEKQRLLLCRAFASSKELLLLDEPTSNVDDDTGMAIFDAIKRSGKTVIAVTHNAEVLSSELPYVELEWERS